MYFNISCTFCAYKMSFMAGMELSGSLKASSPFKRTKVIFRIHVLIKSNFKLCFQTVMFLPSVSRHLSMDNYFFLSPEVKTCVNHPIHNATVPSDVKHPSSNAILSSTAAIGALWEHTIGFNLKATPQTIMHDIFLDKQAEAHSRFISKNQR